MRWLRHRRSQSPRHLAYIVYGVDYQGIYPVCSPRFRVSASVLVQLAAFATGVPLDIYEFHLYTENSTNLSGTQAVAVSGALPGLSPGLSHPTCVAAYTRFTPSNSEQRSHPLSYRGCWHRVSRCLLSEYRHHVIC